MKYNPLLLFILQKTVKPGTSAGVMFAQPPLNGTDKGIAETTTRAAIISEAWGVSAVHVLQGSTIYFLMQKGPSLMSGSTSS